MCEFFFLLRDGFHSRRAVFSSAFGSRFSFNVCRHLRKCGVLYDVRRTSRRKVECRFATVSFSIKLKFLTPFERRCSSDHVVDRENWLSNFPEGLTISRGAAQKRVRVLSVFPSPFSYFDLLLHFCKVKMFFFDRSTAIAAVFRCRCAMTSSYFGHCRLVFVKGVGFRIWTIERHRRLVLDVGFPTFLLFRWPSAVAIGFVVSRAGVYICSYRLDLLGTVVSILSRLRVPGRYVLKGVGLARSFKLRKRVRERR